MFSWVLRISWDSEVKCWVSLFARPAALGKPGELLPALKTRVVKLNQQEW